MSTANLSTLDRIQLEIKESIQREKELKNGYHQTNNYNSESLLNGYHEESKIKPVQELNNGTNGFRKFKPSNVSNKGVMHKFLKSRGRLSLSTFNSSSNQNAWNSDATFKPAKITVEKGSKPLRNGFVSAEQKITRELQDFQQRESRLREERKKSQPNLMAALQLEEDEEFNETYGNLNGGLKSAKSMGNLYNNSDDGFEDNSSSAGGSLKPARSLAELCDLSDDDEGGLPGELF
ncbi:unnamed protein product [Ceutorhynchus assimilis]|uniref:A-kinase anchor protein 2 C-terminal domain-containing protein n=1 Tax=Ceutorhynchus assimilis TaxID=467358 RepID=A0A9N9QFE7_9CUCU|nr:unnamed protein product [Ceutorhynchus assimilis]